MISSKDLISRVEDNSNNIEKQEDIFSDTVKATTANCSEEPDTSYRNDSLAELKNNAMIRSLRYVIIQVLFIIRAFPFSYPDKWFKRIKRYFADLDNYTRLVSEGYFYLVIAYRNSV